MFPAHLLRPMDTIAKVYELVVEAGVYRAESIKVAEAAKVWRLWRRPLRWGRRLPGQRRRPGPVIRVWGAFVCPAPPGL